jgi:AAHS family 4-hydroxybenzoate transporter-like MFS transporter
MFQIGGTIGSVSLGRLMDKFNPYHVLAFSYASGGAFVFLIGLSSELPWLMTLAIFGAGFSGSGSQVGANALAAAYYPTASRATGVAWANAVGRSGAVLGSMLGGVMLTMGWSFPTIFALTAIPGFIAGASMFAVGLTRRRAVPVAVAA